MLIRYSQNFLSSIFTFYICRWQPFNLGIIMICSMSEVIRPHLTWKISHFKWKILLFSQEFFIIILFVTSFIYFFLIYLYYYKKSIMKITLLNVVLIFMSFSLYLTMSYWFLCALYSSEVTRLQFLAVFQRKEDFQERWCIKDTVYTYISFYFWNLNSQYATD